MNNSSNDNNTKLVVPCQIYSRVVGFFTPINQWNKGKKEEFRQRKTYIFNAEVEAEKEEIDNKNAAEKFNEFRKN